MQRVRLDAEVEGQKMSMCQASVDSFFFLSSVGFGLNHGKALRL